MGVPAFFRWLSRKYVSIIVDAVEEKNRDSNGVPLNVDARNPNLNYQVLYLLYCLYSCYSMHFIAGV
jgi:5'-3' exonuclease